MAHNTQSKVKIAVKSPRITEKAALLTDQGVYVFNVAEDSTKNEIAKEIEAIYNVKPVRVNIARAAGKKTFVRGKRGTKAGVKKAYVYLKEGDKISVM